MISDVGSHAGLHLQNNLVDFKVCRRDIFRMKQWNIMYIIRDSGRIDFTYMKSGKDSFKVELCKLIDYTLWDES